MVRVGENNASLNYTSPLGQNLEVCDVRITNNEIGIWEEYNRNRGQARQEKRTTEQYFGNRPLWPHGKMRDGHVI